MTVRQLITLLVQYDPEANVVLGSAATQNQLASPAEWTSQFRRPDTSNTVVIAMEVGRQPTNVPVELIRDRVR